MGMRTSCYTAALPCQLAQTSSQHSQLVTTSSRRVVISPICLLFAAVISSGAAANAATIQRVTITTIATSSNVAFPHSFTAASPIALPYFDSTNNSVDGIKNNYYLLSCSSSSNGGDNSPKTAAAVDHPTCYAPRTCDPHGLVTHYIRDSYL
jgi:hypothetical protein